MSGRVALADLPDRFDLIIVGGGINGAGILREAARTSLRVLLLEQGDFASATSSASSKLIHGGLRYLKTGQWRLTLESVRERRRLLREAPELVEPLEFLMPIYRGVPPGKWTMRIGLWLYDWMAGQSNSRWLDPAAALGLEPTIRSDGLQGAMHYLDAQTDDARLVMRLITEAQAVGGAGSRLVARNYTRVSRLLERDGVVTGVAIEDLPSGLVRDLRARLVIQATGADVGLSPDAPKIRPLRGSHFVFPPSKLPVRRAVSWLHPADRRPIFAYPWLGAIVYGTTDLDHHGASARTPRMSRSESDYLIAGLAHQFPQLKLSATDALSSYAGVRPVVAGGKDNPSAESRESVLWSRPGLVGLAGGKLTTFRVTARHILKEAARQLPELAPAKEQGLFAPRDLSARRVLEDLRGTLQQEQVIHLDDLMLRRTRLGLTEPAGAVALLPEARQLCQQELGWDDARWGREQARYLQLWQENHAPVVPA